MELNFDRSQSVGYLTNWAGRLLVRTIERRLEPHGVSVGYLPVFYALAAGKPLPQKELARRAAVEQPTMAKTLDRMERDGLVTRTPDPADRRSSLISLTPLGREKTPLVHDAIWATNRQALAVLDTDEQTQFMEFLRKVIAGLEG